MRLFMIVERATCPACGTEYDPLRSRAIKVVDGRVRAFCSNSCRDRGVPVAPELTILEEEEPLPPTPRTRYWPVALGIGVGVLGLLAVGGQRLHVITPAALAPAAHAMKPPAPPSADEAMAVFSKANDEAPDIWVHPLVGPERRFPERQTRRFGAGREGMRPDECGSGHCGVDLGGKKGELVMVVHDGVIERVQRDAIEGGHRGNEGRFIMVNHKGGTVVTSYIHLEGIREDLRPGVPVKAGEVIGTVGDTGVKESGPHLHFAVAVRPRADGDMLFIDPEPMLHLWPLKSHPVATLHAMEPSPPAPRPTKTASVVGVAQGM
jgi:murein DD-endopeptidase MepM/ murein hydrolase activator NlpD